MYMHEYQSIEGYKVGTAYIQTHDLAIRSPTLFHTAINCTIEDHQINEL